MPICTLGAVIVPPLCPKRSQSRATTMKKVVDKTHSFANSVISFDECMFAPINIGCVLERDLFTANLDDCSSRSAYILYELVA